MKVAILDPFSGIAGDMALGALIDVGLDADWLRALPAALKLLEGYPVRPGPEGSGELVTPTGAALVRTLSAGRPPVEYTPLRSGFGAGTKEFQGRANALRIVLADIEDAASDTEELVE